jgi:hypothetical protein
MSELINNAERRKALLKHMIEQLHKGEAPEQVKPQLVRLLGEVPYSDVVEVEQELITEGMPQEEVLKLCDVHAEVLKGHIDQSTAKDAPAGHPVHTFKEENRALGWEVNALDKLYAQVKELDPGDTEKTGELVQSIHKHFNNLMDVQKHYVKKENLVFPYLEKNNITGPPTIMWGKHDETRALLKGAMEALKEMGETTAEEAEGIIDLVLEPASKSVEEMIFKEEQILFPMCMDTLGDKDWYEVHTQSPDIGFCLYDPKDEWKPEGVEIEVSETIAGDRIKLPTGSFSPVELNAILNSIPFDMTFVDKDDTVRYFTEGRERIFARNRTIIGRSVQFCHPPSSVDTVERILADFRSGKQDQAAFWINMGGKFIHIEYYALRDDKGEYLGCLEVTQDLTEKRKLEGEQRILSYDDKK